MTEPFLKGVSPLEFLKNTIDDVEEDDMVLLMNLLTKTSNQFGAFSKKKLKEEVENNPNPDCTDPDCIPRHTVVVGICPFCRKDMDFLKVSRTYEDVESEDTPTPQMAKFACNSEICPIFFFTIRLSSRLNY